MSEAARVEVAPVEEVEVTAKATRRRFSAKEKLRILGEADSCKKPGELGALLRREGIYSSSLSSWRRARDEGQLTALGPKRRGPVPVVPDARDKKVAELERAAVKAEARARKAEALVELQKKISELLGIQLPTEDETP
jgi:transposase-like protein